MAVRSFSGTGGSAGRVICAAGGSSGVLAGAWSVFVVINRISGDGNYQTLLSLSGAGGALIEFYLGDGTSITLEGSGSELFAAGMNPTSAKSWLFIAITKATGTSTPRAHMYQYDADAWTHTNFGGTHGNIATTITAINLGYSARYDYSAVGGSVRHAAAALFDTAFSDLQVEALAGGIQDWLDADALSAWLLNQAATTTDVEDVTDGGADQTATSNTTVITDDDPAGFSFDLGGPPAESTSGIDLGLAVAATTRAAHQVSAAIPMGLAVTAQTQATHAAAAAVLLGLELGGTAEAPEVPPAEITAAVPLSVDVVATGRATHQVTTSVPLATALAGVADAPAVADAEVTASIPLGLAVTATTAAEHTVTAGVPLGLAVTATVDAPEIVVPGAVTAQIPLSLAVAPTVATGHRASAAVPLILTLPAVAATARAVTAPVSLALQVTAASQADDPLQPGTATEVPAQTPTAASAPAQTPLVAAAISRVPSSTAVAPLIPTAGGVT